MDLSSWPRVRKLFGDWGYRGLREGEEVPGMGREGGFKPLPQRWVVGGPLPGWGETEGWGRITRTTLR